MISIRSCAVGVLAMGVTACSASTGLSDNVVVVEIAVSAPTVSAEAKVTITVTATNGGTDPVEINVHPCPEVFEVLGIDGQQVGPPTLPCILIALPPQALQPGESFEFHHTWDGAGNRVGINQREPLPLGAYLLRGRVWVMDHGAAFSEVTPIEVVSPD